MRRAVLLLLTLAACAPLRYAHYPWRGPLICVQNRADEPLTVVARAPIGRALVMAQRVAPDSRATFRWPFTAATGQLLAGPWGTRVFEPWSADRWSWSIGDTLRSGGCP